MRRSRVPSCRRRSSRARRPLTPRREDDPAAGRYELPDDGPPLIFAGNDVLQDLGRARAAPEAADPSSRQDARRTKAWTARRMKNPPRTRAECPSRFRTPPYPPRSPPFRIGVRPHRAGLHVHHRQRVLHIRQCAVEHPELAVQGPSVEHLQDDFHIILIEEPEEAARLREGTASAVELASPWTVRRAARRRKYSSRRQETDRARRAGSGDRCSSETGNRISGRCGSGAESHHARLRGAPAVRRRRCRRRFPAGPVD